MTEYTGLGIKKSNEDKLVYRLEIQNAIQRCRLSIDTLEFRAALDGLISIINFDIVGYDFHTEINNIKYDLHVESKLRFYRYLQRYGTEAAAAQNLMKYKLIEHNWYNHEMMRRIIQKLAEEDLLFETGKVTKYKEVKRFDTHGTGIS